MTAELYHLSARCECGDSFTGHASEEYVREGFARWDAEHSGPGHRRTALSEGPWRKWSVLAGTSWLIVEAISSDQAKVKALQRLGRAEEIYDRSITRRRLAPRDPRDLDHMVARPATPGDLDAFEDIAETTHVRGGRKSRLARLAPAQIGDTT